MIANGVPEQIQDISYLNITYYTRLTIIIIIIIIIFIRLTILID